MTLPSQPNLSEQLVARLRQMICDGVLQGGQRINEIHLSKDLGVSRTPLREALSRLCTEGAIKSVARHGFFVEPLTLEDFAGLYSIRQLLDPEALRLSGIPSAAHLAHLDKCNEQILQASTLEDAIVLDDEWHLALVAECPYTVMLDLIRDFMRRTRRYEMAYFRETQNICTAIDEHKAILAALRAGDLESACAALKQNMTSGIEPIRHWLETRV